MIYQVNAVLLSFDLRKETTSFATQKNPWLSNYDAVLAFLNCK